MWLSLHPIRATAGKLPMMAASLITPRKRAAHVGAGAITAASFNGRVVPMVNQ